MRRDVEAVARQAGRPLTVREGAIVQAVEGYRARCLRGDGPIFALHETVDAIVDAEDRERRQLTLKERALVWGIRRKTFVRP